VPHAASAKHSPNLKGQVDQRGHPKSQQCDAREAVDRSHSGDSTREPRKVSSDHKRRLARDRQRRRRRRLQLGRISTRIESDDVDLSLALADEDLIDPRRDDDPVRDQEGAASIGRALACTLAVALRVTVRDIGPADMALTLRMISTHLGASDAQAGRR
jgi:hypothetical protein